MRVTITVTRFFEMNEERILSEPGFRPPPESASDAEKRSWLEESFYELCGFERDEDHLDGRYVRREDEEVISEFDWPSVLP